jgi:allophanate hydrolase
MPERLLISQLLAGYRARRFTPLEVLVQVFASIARAPELHAWITLLPRDQVLAHARDLLMRPVHSLPLYGIPFAIKDNIDLEGVPTTAACPDYAYVPKTSAHVVQKLIDAGAIPIGKTNLDQFATGLVGTRSPYGICRNSFNPEYIAGGSSSGSAVAVAAGLVSFALGTDTAGSGRVPAAFNNIIGMKPTAGRLSTRGVVPACRSLDCVSIFALTADDAARVCAVAEGYDADDPFSRVAAPAPQSVRLNAPGFRFGVPRTSQLEFFGDTGYADLFFEAIGRLQALGGTLVEIDLTPFRTAAKLLYEGPWIAERYTAVAEFLERKPESLLPVTLEIISAGRKPTAVDAFHGQHRLLALKREVSSIWNQVDMLVTPTTGTIYRIEQIQADLIRLNSTLGYYTNFVNLLDLAAVAVPSGFRRDGLPFGVTFVGPAWSDYELLQCADRMHRASVQHLGALTVALPQQRTWPVEPRADHIAVAVCGAHMEGLPLNHQLVSRGAYLLRRGSTAPTYRFYALPGGPPFRPGLVRVASGGEAIDVEVWAVPASAFGSFVAEIPAPLGIGKVELDSGEPVAGFLCEAYAVAQAEDITELGGWRAYLSRGASE